MGLRLNIKNFHPILFFYITAIVFLSIIATLTVLAPSHTGLTQKFSIHAQNILLLIFLSHIILGLGELVFGILRIKTDLKNVASNFFISFAIGCVLLSQIVLLLSALKILTFRYFTLPFLLFIFVLPFLKNFYIRLNRYLVEEKIFRSYNFQLGKIIYGILLLLLLSTLLLTFAPPIAWDAQTYHLLIPKNMLIEQGFTYIPLNIYSNMPFNMNLLYTFAMGLGREELVRIFSGFLSLMLILGLGAIAKNIFYSTAKVGWLSGLILLALPVVLYGANEALVDVQMGFFSLIAVWCFLRWIEEKRFSYLILTGCICGFLAGCKYTGSYVPIAIFLMGLLLSQKGDFKKILIIPISMIIFMIPWGVKSYIYTGNPVYPLLYDFFDGRDWTKQMYNFLIDWQDNIGMGRSVMDYILLPARVFFMSDEGYPNFAGKLSPLPLIFFLFPILYLNLLIKNKRNLKQATACIFIIGVSVISFCLWAYGPQQVRFLIPSLVIICLSGAIGFQLFLENLKNKILAKLISVLVILCLIPMTIIPNIDNFKNLFSSSSYIFGRMSKQEFLTNHVWSYRAFEFLEEKIERESSDNNGVLFIFENMGYYFKGKFYADSMFEASYIIDLAANSPSPDEFRENIKERFNIKYILVNKHILKMCEDGIYDEAMSPFANTKNREIYLKGFLLLKDFLATQCEKGFEANGCEVYILRD